MPKAWTNFSRRSLKVLPTAAVAPKAPQMPERCQPLLKRSERPKRQVGSTPRVTAVISSFPPIPPLASATAKAEIERRAAVGHACEQAAYQGKMAERARKEQPGKQPQPLVPDPTAKDQVNLTDENSRIMPTSGGFKQC
jgi:hypothetical protein